VFNVDVIAANSAGQAKVDDGVRSHVYAMISVLTCLSISSKALEIKMVRLLILRLHSICLDSLPTLPPAFPFISPHLPLSHLPSRLAK
jgi:hypothetical protein